MAPALQPSTLDGIESTAGRGFSAGYVRAGTALQLYREDLRRRLHVRVPPIRTPTRGGYANRERTRNPMQSQAANARLQRLELCYWCTSRNARSVS
jgi:hypothetical protein